MAENAGWRGTAGRKIPDAEISEELEQAIYTILEKRSEGIPISRLEPEIVKLQERMGAGFEFSKKNLTGALDAKAEAGEIDPELYGQGIVKYSALGGESGAASFGIHEKAKLTVAIESALINADSYCLTIKDLFMQIAKDPEAKRLLTNISGVEDVVNQMMDEKKLDPDAHSIGIFSLTPNYKEQFQNPMYVMERGDNESKKSLSRETKEILDCEGCREEAFPGKIVDYIN